MTTNERKALRNLASAILNDEAGISEKSYLALLTCLPKEDDLTLRRLVDATDGRFYLPTGTKVKWATFKEKK